MANENKSFNKVDNKDQGVPKGIDLVLMFRGAPQFDGGPTEAWVHPSEVSNYADGGWQKK